MTKSTLLSALALIFTFQCFSTANFVVHEHTTNSVGGTCGQYVDNLNPTSAQTVTIQFAIDYAGFTNRARVYYTTDGTIPNGSHGVGSGTTQVLTAAYVCTYTDMNGDLVDVVQAVIPAQPVGTTVNYIIGAWHTGSGASGGLEVFGTSDTSIVSTQATQYSYSIAAALPLRLVDFSGKKINDNVQLSWTTQQELNVDHYEVYRSSNGTMFQSIGSQKATGTSSLTNNYYFNDLNTYRGNNFYKIKSVDIDGNYSFTQVIKLAFDNRSLVHLTAAGNILHLTLSSTQRDKYFIKLINSSGQLIKTFTIFHDGITTAHELSLPVGLPKNIYQVAVYANGLRFSQSILN